MNADEIAGQLKAIPESRRQLAAAQRAEAERERLIAERKSFAIETVFSRTEYWLRFIEKAREHSFEILLFFLCTADPLLNAARVESRVREGGHAVPIGKIASRYPGSITTAVSAVPLADELWLYDNSRPDRSPTVAATIVSGKIVYLSPGPPRWAEPFILSPEGR